jgi:hypothetical protein
LDAIIEKLGMPLVYAIMVALALSLGSLLSNALGVGEPADAVDVIVSGAMGAVLGYGIGWWRQHRGKEALSRTLAAPALPAVFAGGAGLAADARDCRYGTCFAVAFGRRGRLSASSHPTEGFDGRAPC